MKDNESKSRFELEENGYVTFADYKIENGTLYIKYVEAPQEARGTGSAGRLMLQVAEHAKQNGFKIVPICGYAAAWLKRHDEFRDIVSN